MARKTKSEAAGRTLAQKRTAENDTFRAGIRPTLEQEAKDTARRLEDNDAFRKEQTKLALAEARTSRKP